MPTPTRILVVAFDAADRTLAARLAGDGKMPVLRSLLDQGRSVEVESPYGLFVGAVWPTFQTAVNAGRHGRYCFGQVVPGTYLVRRTAGGYPRRPFWSALSDAGRRSAVIDVPHSAWPQPGFDGVHIVDWLRHDRNVELHTTPSMLADELTARFGARDLCDAYAKRGAYGELRDDLVASIGAKADLCESYLVDGGWDVFLTVFHASHCVGHQFWALHDPDHPSHDAVAKSANGLGDPIVDVYRAQDAALGRLISTVGSDTTVMLLLSHGMGPHYDATFLLGEMLRRIATRSAVSRSALVRERAHRGLGRLARRKHGTEPGQFMWYVDGGRPFFPIPNNDVCGAIRINVRGREPQGLVAPGREFDDTCEMLETELSTWTNLETGEPLVRRVVRVEDRYDGPERDHLPDLIVEWNRRAPIRDIGSQRYGRIEREYHGHRTGDHIPGGLLVTRGPGIQPGPSPAAMSMEDVAPTIAAAVDVELPDVDGTVQADVIGAAPVRS